MFYRAYIELYKYQSMLFKDMGIRKEQWMSYDACGKFGEDESRVSFLSALQTSQLHHDSIYAHLKATTVL